MSHAPLAKVLVLNIYTLLLPPVIHIGARLGLRLPVGLGPGIRYVGILLSI